MGASAKSLQADYILKVYYAKSIQGYIKQFAFVIKIVTEYVITIILL
jgi:hypothetical protein